jgi:hypothetical protein
VAAHELEMVMHELKGTAANLALVAVSASAADVLAVMRAQGVPAALAASRSLLALLGRVTTLLESDRLDRLLASL